MTEDASDSDEDFFEALTLLHSTDNDSEEKLQRMLDMIIQREYGFEKTLIARMPIRFLQNARTREESSSNNNTVEREERPQKRANICRKHKSVPVNDTIADNCVSVKTVETESDDCDEEEDIPTISIPDEGSTDGLLCKICNGAKLGPLILLECQECQEVYHPLCHQPPVVDIDVYDPRIVWRCSKCVDAASTNSSATAVDGRKLKKFRQREISIKIDTLEELEENLSKNKMGITREESKCCSQKTVAAENILPASSVPQLLPKTMKSSTSNQLRRRIGSKLSVTRSIAKR